MATIAPLDIWPATPARWNDLAALFGKSGACGGCWCMWWRLPARAYQMAEGQKHRDALRALVESGREPGLLAYVDGQPAGWCAVAPRSEYARLVSSRTIHPVDDRPVWSVVCFFIARPQRRQGIARALLAAAEPYAAAHGAPALEAYPIAAEGAVVKSDAAYTGTLSMFLAAGFQAVAETGSKSGGVPRVIVRKELAG